MIAAHPDAVLYRRAFLWRHHFIVAGAARSSRADVGRRADVDFAFVVRRCSNRWLATGRKRAQPTRALRDLQHRALCEVVSISLCHLTDTRFSAYQSDRLRRELHSLTASRSAKVAHVSMSALGLCRGSKLVPLLGSLESQHNSNAVNY
ncbi:hypothetical protein D3C71_1560180 [compost metagenome]